MPNTFVIGDIHGAYRALRQCLERSNFNYEDDHLISLGDVCDGWPETRQCIEELLSIKKLTYIFGNHDYWTLEWMKGGYIDNVWFKQGGEATIKSYHNGVPEAHLNFLEEAKEYFILNNTLFVHAGINPFLPIGHQTAETFLWDRDLAKMAVDYFTSGRQGPITTFDEVYIGHTPVTFRHPIKGAEVWLMDTGAGWSGVLSMMNLETREMFISDAVPSLYPGVEGRKKK